jgi:hypothetical protein
VIVANKNRNSSLVYLACQPNKMFRYLCTLFLVCLVVAAPWDHYNLSPETRTIRPVAVHATHGTVDQPTNIIKFKPTGLIDQGSFIVLDFGKNIGGDLTVHVSSVSEPNRVVGLAFSESSLHVGNVSDDSAGRDTPDGAITFSVSSPSNYTTPPALLRGGFRYLTIFHATSGRVDIDLVSVHFSAAPDMQSPRNYPNYFFCSDDLLNRIWYAGAYTVQLCTIPSNQGRAFPPPKTEWKNDVNASEGSSVLVDGAKRDRTIWSGDLGISIPTAFVTTNDLIPVRNALTTLFKMQKPTGELSWSGPNMNLWSSDTYHMWTLISAALYYRFSNDKPWLDQIWNKHKLGVNFVLEKINKQGLLNVTNIRDWLRSYQGGDNIAANAVMYRLLTECEALAIDQGDQPLADTYLRIASKLKKAANNLLWDTKIGMYRDNSTTENLYPQDGNAMAVWFGIVDSVDKIESIIKQLTSRWVQYGATTPEKNSPVSGTSSVGTFTGSMEVYARFVANYDDSALELIRRQWGYMLKVPIGTNSTFWEGLLSDGSFNWIGAKFSSLAHGWATGPTTALTYYALGIIPKSAGVETFSFIPHPGDLTFVQGKLHTPNGDIIASWKRAEKFEMLLDAPKDVIAETIGVPTFGKIIKVTVNGKQAWDGKKGHLYDAHSDGRYVYLESVWGGQHYEIIGL